MRTVALANQTRTTLVLNLPSNLVPELATRAVVGTREHDGRRVRGAADASAPGAGARRVRAHKRVVSGSITLQPKGTPGDIARGLPESVLRAPDVDRAIKAWPPKVAAKTLNADERRAEEAARAEQAAKAKATADESKQQAATKAAKRARIAGASEEVPVTRRD